MEEDRRSAIKKAILDYILLDATEQDRLGIPVPAKVRQPGMSDSLCCLTGMSESLCFHTGVVCEKEPIKWIV